MGTFTLKQVIQNTRQFMPNRFLYMERDVIKSVQIIEQKILHPDRSGAPSIRYLIRTKSYPQYGNYLKDRQGRKRLGSAKQRTWAHEYDTVFTIDRLSINSKNWKMRLGSGRIWRTDVSSALLKTMSRDQKKQLRNEMNRRYGSTQRARDEYKRRINAQWRKGKYLDIGDYNAKELGINADFIFRQAYVFHKHEHYYGRNYYGWKPPVETNPRQIMYFPKHVLRLLEFLINRHILKDN